MTKTLGRLFIPDERDKKYHLKSLMPKAAVTITSKYWWAAGWWGDQGETSECVAYSWTHWLAEGPIVQKGKPPINPDVLYNEAQKVDEWPGENYDGTSVRAGAKVLQSKGFISTYNWAWDIETVKTCLLTTGPMVVGTLWYDNMFYPDINGLIKVGGAIAGGHAYLLDGINVKTGLIRIKNSWGKSWGKGGFAYISIADMEKLILDDGEACLATEIKK